MRERGRERKNTGCILQLLCTHHLPICFLHSQIPHSFYTFDSLVSFLYSTLLFTSPSQISASQDPPSTMKPRPSLQISRQNLKKLSCSAMLTLAYQSLGVVHGDLSTSPLYVHKTTFSESWASTRMMRKFMVCFPLLSGHLLSLLSSNTSSSISQW